MEQTKLTRLIVGITGATGTIFGVRLLQMLHGSGVETHLVVSKWAARTLAHETPHSLKYVQSLATQSYGIGAQLTLALGQGDVKAALPEADALQQKLQGEGGLATP